MFSTSDGDFEDFFCFLSWRLLLLTDDVSESDISLRVRLSLRKIVRLSLRKMGVSFLVNGVDCVADGPAISSWVGGAAIGTGGLKWCICVRSGLFTKASSCLGLRLGNHILRARQRYLKSICENVLMRLHSRPFVFCCV